ncbi:MAG: hypothetical protein V7717_06030 [Porticoccaceae bacterium]
MEENVLGHIDKVFEGLAFEFVWQNVTSELIEEAKNFWVSENAIPASGDVESRARQLMVVVRDSEHKIIAVSTAECLPIPQLLNNMFYYFRCFVSSSRRQEGLLMEMCHKAREYTHPQFLSGENTEAKGFYYSLESEILREMRTEAVLTVGGIDHSFIGLDNRGRRLFVGWFDGATID